MTSAKHRTVVMTATLFHQRQSIHQLEVPRNISSEVHVRCNNSGVQDRVDSLSTFWRRLPYLARGLSFMAHDLCPFIPRRANAANRS